MTTRNFQAKVKGKWIHASEKIEAVPSGPGPETKRLPAPNMTGESLQCEIDGIHEIEPAISFFRLFYNRLQRGNPFSLLLGTRFARYGLCLYEPEATAVQYLPCPCQAERYAAYVPDYVRRLSCIPGHFGFQSPGNLLHVTFQPA